MNASPYPEIDTLVRHLRESGVDIHDPGTGELAVAPRGAGGPPAVVVVAEQDLHDYVAELATSYGRGADDPWWSAQGLTAVHVEDHLTTDHGVGVNRVRRLELIRDDRGLRFVEERTDDPPPRPATGDAPHDDPAVFAAELEALAAHLRDQGLDAVADSDGATLRVTGEDDPDAMTVALRPDRYRRWFAAAEEEFGAIGGEPRDHAWRLWCRMVAMSLTRSPAERLALVEAPDGEVLLRPDEPPAAEYDWSAEPGA